MVLRPGPGAQTLLWWLACLLLSLPLVLLIKHAVSGSLGADPAKVIVDSLGFWALVSLWLALAITPLRKLLNLPWLIRFRRMLGVFSFFYTLLHFLAFATFLVGWRTDLLQRELGERPYIIVGAIALLLLIPLAITSTNALQRRLGKRWKTLHKLVYPISLLVMLHFIWQIRSDFSEQLIFGILLALMLGYRLYIKRRS